MGIALAGATAISFAPMLYALISGEGPLTGAILQNAVCNSVLWFMSVMWGGADERKGRGKLMAFGAGLVLAFDFVSYHSAIDWVGTGIATLIGFAGDNRHIVELVVVRRAAQSSDYDCSSSSGARASIHIRHMG